MTNDRFREVLRMDFQDMTVESKQELGTLMRLAGYNIRKKKMEKGSIKAYPTQLQLDSAWYYIRKMGYSQAKITTLFKTEKYTKHAVDRAEENVYIRGKLYKKGQFLPKKKEL